MRPERGQDRRTSVNVVRLPLEPQTLYLNNPQGRASTALRQIDDPVASAAWTAYKSDFALDTGGGPQLRRPKRQT